MENNHNKVLLLLMKLNESTLMNLVSQHTQRQVHDTYLYTVAVIQRKQ